MFSQSNDETKLNWMYKGANSLVDREEYLLGRNIDKTLEQLNAEEKQKTSNQLSQPKNHVEHECIPPSIRDYNKITLADQVDLAAKLQEDPLVAIRKREEETRKQFLQNPIQLKKLQKALKSQQKDNKKKKSKKSKHKKSDKDIDNKLIEKLNQLKNNPLGLGFSVSNKKSDRDEDLDNELIHKFNKLKRKLTESDIKAILEGKETSSEEDNLSSDEDFKQRMARHSKQRNRGDDNRISRNRRRYSNLSACSEESDNYNKKNQRKNQERYNRHKEERNVRDGRANNYYKSRREYNSNERINKRKTAETYKRSKNTESDLSASEDDSKKKKNWGLVTHDGKKINLNRNTQERREDKKETSKAETSRSNKPRVKLSEEEKEKKRREMMENAAWRDIERVKNVKKYREEDLIESKQLDYDPEFIHNQLAKATSTSSVESRIKANLNNIQRSSTHMDRNFSRRH